MARSERFIHVYAKDRSFSVIPHVIIWRFGNGRNRELLFASYVGVPEAVTAVSASILEGRELDINGKSYCRILLDPYKRVEKPMGMGDVAHGCIYDSFFDLSAVEAMNDADAFNRALILAPDGNIKQAVVDHAMSRFGLPPEWESHYYRYLDDFVEPLYVEANPQFKEWAQTKACLFTGTDVKVMDAISQALRMDRLVIPPSTVEGRFDPNWSMSQYLTENAEALARRLEEKQPRHTFNQPLDPSIADLKRIPFPVQGHMIQGIINTLESGVKGVFNSGDMGSGKSIIACGVVHALHERRKRRGSKKGTAVLLSAPGITLAKWQKKEIEGTIPNVKVHIIRSGNDALALLRKVRGGYKPSGIEFTLVGIDRAKLGSEPFFAGVWKRVSGTKGEQVEYAWHCSDCGKPIRIVKDKKGEEWENAGWNEFAEGTSPSLEALAEARHQRELLPNGLPKGYSVKWRRQAGIPTKCTNELRQWGWEAEDRATAVEKYPDKICGSSFYRPALKSRGETKNKPRVNISQVLKRTKRYFSLYVADEIHQSKAENSGRGDAFAQMVKAAEKVLCLTGTVTNGKSTSIKELLWRLDPKSILDKGMNHKTGTLDWAKRYGKVEEVIYNKEGDEGVVTRRKKREVQTREAPGIAPQLTAEHLLHRAGFIELGDMGLPLVELKEIPVFLDMDEDHAEEYKTFHEELFDTCAQASRVSDNKGVWSKFNPATIMYADRPDLGMSVTIGDTTISAPPLFSYDELHAKERWLVDKVLEELSEGRRVVIYNNFTGAYQMNERIRDILIRHGIRCQVLDDPNTDTRSERLAEYEAAEIPVLITQMKLVEVGLDLLYWPTIIYYQLNYEVNVVRQSSRRAWRIGQDKECRVYYVLYNGTQQVKQFQHIMAARGHALLTEGRLDKSELARYSLDGRTSLARDLATCFAGSDLAQAWQSLAAKELEGLEIVKEGQFQDVLKQRMKELADATLRLCGIDPDIWRDRKEAEASKAKEDLEDHVLNWNFDEPDVDVQPMDLYDLFQKETAQELLPVIATPTEVDEVDFLQLMTFAEMIAADKKATVGGSRKNTKKQQQRRSSMKFLDDQLLISL